MLNEPDHAVPIPRPRGPHCAWCWLRPACSRLPGGGNCFDYASRFARDRAVDPTLPPFRGTDEPADRQGGKP